MLPAANLADRLSVDVQGAQSLRARAASGDPEALRGAARQFEAMVVQIMLKTMRQTRFTAEGDTFGDSNNLKVYQDLLDQQWAQKMVTGKGLGFADAIVKRLGVEAAGKAIQERLDADIAGLSESTAALAEQMAAPAPAPVSAAQPATPAVIPAAQASDRPGQFLASLLPHARQAEAATGVPARFILGHAALESGWGQREIRDADGQASHNLFGIKATGWTGANAEVTTTEYRQGLAMKVSQRFRAYADYAEAFTDYARLLQQRYGDAVAAGDDAAAFAQGLARGGYATDPAYADKLQRTIASVSERLAQG